MSNILDKEIFMNRENLKRIIFDQHQVIKDMITLTGAQTSNVSELINCYKQGAQTYCKINHKTI